MHINHPDSLDEHAVVAVDTFDVVKRNLKKREPMALLESTRITCSRDALADEVVTCITTWLAAKKTSKTVRLEEIVTFRAYTPKTWFDHLLIEHPWLSKVLFWYDPEQEELVECRHVSKEETVEFAAVIPELKVPEQIIHEDKKTFDVYYTVL